MHRFGKLTSCDSENPAAVDIMFVEELLNIIKKNER